MIMFLNARTNAAANPDVDSILVSIHDKKILLTWDESDVSINNGLYEARMKGIYIDDEYGNGRIIELVQASIAEVNFDNEEIKLIDDNKFIFDIIYFHIMDGDDEFLMEAKGDSVLFKAGECLS